jgi:hypothetical protein
MGGGGRMSLGRYGGGVWVVGEKTYTRPGALTTHILPKQALVVVIYSLLDNIHRSRRNHTQQKQEGPIPLLHCGGLCAVGHAMKHGNKAHDDAWRWGVVRTHRQTRGSRDDCLASGDCKV